VNGKKKLLPSPVKRQRLKPWQRTRPLKLLLFSRQKPQFPMAMKCQRVAALCLKLPLRQ
jgi:hypothetical protein